MNDVIPFDHNQLRLGIFLGLLISLIVLEWLIPWRDRSVGRKQRWWQNLALTGLNTMIARFTLGAAPLAVSYYCYRGQLGLLHLSELPIWLQIVLTYVLLDFLIYLQHIMFHATPALWRLHKVHHSDPDLDVTSGFRFHPIEIVLSLVLKVGAIFMLGAHPLGVLLFEILLNAGSLFNHSNIRIPPAIERWLRWLVITPRLHLIHHSVNVPETNSNFGFTISIWDRIFGTFKGEAGEPKITIGLSEFRAPRELGLGRLLFLPFMKAGQDYSMNGRQPFGETNNKP